MDAARGRRVLAVLACAGLAGACRPAGPGRGPVAVAALAAKDEGQPVSADVCRPAERTPGQLVRGDPPAPLAGITSVSISVQTAEGMSAGRAVWADGAVSGHHLSGEPGRPFVSVEQGRVDAACVRALWAVAGRLARARAGTTPPAPVPGTHRVTLEVRQDGQTRPLAGWTGREPPADADTQELARLLGTIGIGYW